MLNLEHSGENLNPGQSGKKLNPEHGLKSRWTSMQFTGSVTTANPIDFCENHAKCQGHQVIFMEIKQSILWFHEKRGIC